MSLKQEIELNRDFQSKQEEALLALLWTQQQLTKLSAGFFRKHNLTDTQFNALMIIADYQEDGIRQFELARRLVINPASAGTLIDALEKKKWIIRSKVPTDRRAYNLSLTLNGTTTLNKFRPAYYELLSRCTADMNPSEFDRLTELLNQFRRGFTSILGNPEGSSS